MRGWWNTRWRTSDRACCIRRGRLRVPTTPFSYRAVPAKKQAQAAIRGDEAKFESTAQEWGYRIGSQIYDAYLAGKVAPSGLRRLFLAHLNEPGLARKVCATVISKLRSISRPLSRSAHA